MQDNLARKLNTEPVALQVKRAKPSHIPAKSVLSFVTFLVFCSALLMTVILGYARINELEKDILIAKQSYETLYSENTTAKVNLQGSIDLNEIERIATEEYGMVTPDQDQIVNIRVAVDNRAEVLSGNADNSSAADSSGSFMSNIVSYSH